ncbi:hypothetical protein M0802_002219 [Mischocyttarus mexicanus]|nr:hypothetical protein M0802_002219 [Mischocyttarus mexicanus]
MPSQAWPVALDRLILGSHLHIVVVVVVVVVVMVVMVEGRKREREIVVDCLERNWSTGTGVVLPPKLDQLASQAGRQPVRRAGKQASKQASKQATRQASKQAATEPSRGRGFTWTVGERDTFGPRRAPCS